MSPELVILLVGAFVAASCALVGSFLVLRGLSMLGDAISHAVLPGIVAAFFLAGGRDPFAMLLGAALVGLLTVFLVELFQRTRRLKEDASIGVVFPGLFSIGVILIARYAANVDLDMDCVLFGEIAFTPWDTWIVGGTSLGPRALWITGLVLLVNLVAIAVFYKELKLTSFDAGLAAALGFSPLLVHYALMGLVSFTVVGAFESVGAILVVAMLVTPPAAAYLLTERLGTMLGLAVAIGVASAWIGYAIARGLDASIAGAMAATSGAFFLLALLASPRHGVISRSLQHRRLALALGDKLILLHLDDEHRPLSPEELRARFRWSARRFERALRRLLREGLVLEVEGRIALSEAGHRHVEASALPRDPAGQPLPEAPVE